MTTELKAATAASSPWEQATLFINGKKVEWGAELVLLRGQESEVTVEAPPAIARALNLGLADNGGLGTVASPEFGAWVAPVNGKFIWKITPDTGKSGRITLVFFSREVLVPWEHRSLVISSNLADEAEALLDGEVFPVGFIFKSGEVKMLSLRVKDDSPLAGLPLKLTYQVVEGDDLQVTSEPDFGVAQTDYKWNVTGVFGNGAFKLRVEGSGMTPVLDLPICRIMSDSEDDPLIIMVDGKVIPHRGQVLVPISSSHTVTIKPNKMKPDILYGTTNTYGGVTITPDWEIPQVVDPVEGATWQVVNNGFPFRQPVMFWYVDSQGYWEPATHFFLSRS